MLNVVSLTCPNCGAPLSKEQKNCEYCHAPVIIEDLNSLDNLNLNKYIQSYSEILKNDNENQDINFSLAMCYLKLKLYDNAIKHFELSTKDNIGNSKIYFYCAIVLLKGKKPFSTPLADVEKIIEYLNAAILLENKPIYHYFLSYIKYDFYERKFLNIAPDYKEELEKAKSNITESEINSLFDILGQNVPSQIEI